MPGPRDPSIEKFLLEPLGILFTPLTDERRVLYLDALKRLTDTQLKGAFEILRENYEYTRFPSIAEIIKAGRSSTPPNERTDRGERLPNPAQLKDEERSKLVNDYCQKFDKDYLMQQAQTGGWWWPLWEYVRAVANVQAQMIVPCPHGMIGYNGGALFGWGSIPNDEFYRRKAALFGECRKQAGMGAINVTVPDEHIEQWKRYVTTQEGASLLYELPNEITGHMKTSLYKITGTTSSDNTLADNSISSSKTTPYTKYLMGVDEAPVF